MEKSSLLLVDGHSLANRAFYALPPLSTNKGVQTGAVFGFLSMLIRFIQEKRPTHVAVAFDHPSPTFRHDQFTDYKKTRKPSPLEFTEQIPILKETLESLNLRYIEAPGYEADDIIGTMAVKAEKSGFHTIILSGDRDCLQLVNGNVESILPVRGITLVKVYTPESVKSDMGLEPGQIVDYKALAGDSSDNIPGVKGVGQKTALALLSEYGNLDNVYANLRAVSPLRVQKLLAAGREQAYLSRDLAVIKTDVPLEEQCENFLWQGPVFEKAKAKFTELEFTSLLPRLSELDTEHSSQPSGTHAEPSHDRFRAVEKSEDLLSLVNAVKKSKQMSVYAEGTEVKKGFAWPHVLGISAASDVSYLLEAPDPENAIREDQTKWHDELWRHLGPLLMDKEIQKIGFDLKWLFSLCFRRGVGLEGSYFDALVGAYLLDPTRNMYKLQEISRKYGAEISFEPDDHRHYAAGAAALFAVSSGLEQEMDDLGLLSLAEEVEFPLIKVLGAMEASGVEVDLALGQSIRENFGEVLLKLEGEIHQIAGEEFNLGSPKQLSHILFEKLGLKPVKKTKTGYSTDAGVLEILSLEHQLPGLIMEYRQYAKLKSTYLDTLEDVINPVTGRVHSHFHQTVTATGRLSSSDPNLQNIPVRGDLGRSLRRIFIPAAGKLFMAADYSQIELRIMAHMAQDPTMIEAFRKGEDIHARTASEMFGVPIDQVDSDLRSKAKAVNFGVIYGISDFGLARNTGVTREEAKQFIDAYFARYPKVREYMDASIQNASKTGYAVTILGRRRPIPDINARIRQKRGAAERTAINTPIQGSAADIIKLAMVRIHEKLTRRKLSSAMILQVHDELIFEVPPDEESAMKELVTGEMEHVMELSVPLKVGLAVGKSWFDV